MNRYPRTTPWTAALGFAAAAATAVTIGVTVVMPAKMIVEPAASMSAVARNDVRPVEVAINPARIDVVATRAATTASSNSFGSLVLAFFARKPS